MEGQKALKQSAANGSDCQVKAKWKAAKASCYASKAGPANGEAAQSIAAVGSRRRCDDGARRLRGDHGRSICC